MKILMVCLGNICRSPLAEGILRDKLEKAQLNWVVESAGTNAFHIGHPPHKLSCKVAALHGIDISRQVARRFTSEDFKLYDIIYAMAEDVIDEMKFIAGHHFIPGKVKLLLNELEGMQHTDVPDPWYGEEDGYHKVYDLLDEACEAVLQNHYYKNLQHD